MTENHLTTKEFYSRKEVRRTFWRACWLQGVNTYARQQGLGFGTAMIPYLEYLYSDDKEALAKSLEQHTELFNITPQCVNFVMGIVMSMEDEAKKNKDFDRTSISSVKVALMGPLSGVGDAIFWGSWRAISIGIALSFSQQGSVLGPILFLLIFNSLGWAIRYYGMKLGYERGMDFIASATSNGLLEDFTMAAKILGSVVVGYMMAATIGLTTSITFNINGVSTSLQSDIFDVIMPNFLSLVLTFVTYHYVKKGKSTNWILMFLVIIAIVLALLENVPFLKAAA